MRAIYKKDETIYYNEVVTNNGNSNIGNLQVRKGDAPVDISLKTSKRIKEIIDIWISVADVTVCTLEYKQWTESTNIHIKRDIHNFTRNLKTNGADEFLWRLEFNADGKAHFHVLYQSSETVDVQKIWKHGLVYFTSFNERSLGSNKLSSYISKRKSEPNDSAKVHKIKHGMSDNLRNYKYPKGYAKDLPTDAKKIGDYAYSSKDTSGFEEFIETWHDN